MVLVMKIWLGMKLSHFELSWIDVDFIDLEIPQPLKELMKLVSVMEPTSLHATLFMTL